MVFILIGVFVAVLLIIVFYFLNKKRTQKNLEQVGEPWTELMENFRRTAPQIKSLEQLEEYLNSINGEVKKYETIYDFLIVFNSEIRLIRDRLKNDKSDTK